MRKRIIIIMLFVISSIVFASWFLDVVTVNGNNFDSTNHEIQISVTTLKKGEKRQATLTNSVPKNILWESTHPDVAEIDANGIITAKKNGTSLIQSCYHGHIYEKKVLVCTPVRKIKVETNQKKDSLHKEYYLLKPKQDMILSVSVFPKEASNKKVFYQTSNKKICSITQNGKITAKKTGNVEVSVSSTDGTKIEKKIKIHVFRYVKKIQTQEEIKRPSTKGYPYIDTNGEIKRIESQEKGYQKNMVFITAGKKKTLEDLKVKISVKPKKATNKKLHFQSSNEDIFEIDQNKTITAKQTGIAEIIISSTDGTKRKKKIKLWVRPAKEKPVTIKLNNIEDLQNALKEHDGEETQKRFILQKGTYLVSRVIRIPSNTILEFENGVILNKAAGTSLSMFQFVSDGVVRSGQQYRKFNGVHDIKIIGRGTVKVNLNYYQKDNKGSIGFVFGHSKNIQMENIQFEKMSQYGHFIELNSSQNITIRNCSFSKAQRKGIKEAINVDSTDLSTKGFNNDWSSHDKTCCENILIYGCKFYDLQAAIGTHKYSYSYNQKKQMYHKNIHIEKNTFMYIGDNRSKAACIRTMNWLNPVIKQNSFEHISYSVFKLLGCVKPQIQDNFAKKYENFYICKTAKNKGTGSKYPMSKNIF